MSALKNQAACGKAGTTNGGTKMLVHGEGSGRKTAVLALLGKEERKILDLLTRTKERAQIPECTMRFALGYQKEQSIKR